jgi:hypothetical protein
MGLFDVGAEGNPAPTGLPTLKEQTMSELIETHTQYKQHSAAWLTN